jgi:hypothetical protein
MPTKYEHIRDAYIAKGMSEEEAKKLAAMTYNSQRKAGEEPVTRNYDENKETSKQD